MARTALAEAGAPVVAVSRTPAEFPESANGAGTIQPEIADAGDQPSPTASSTATSRRQSS